MSGSIMHTAVRWCSFGVWSTSDWLHVDTKQPFPPLTSCCKASYAGSSSHFLFCVFCSNLVPVTAGVSPGRGREASPVSPSLCVTSSLFVCACPCVPALRCLSPAVIIFTQWKSHYILTATVEGFRASGPDRPNECLTITMTAIMAWKECPEISAAPLHRPPPPPPAPSGGR